MKRFYIIAVLIACCIASVAQRTEGIITYDRKVNMHKRITDENIRAMIPEFRTSKHVLLFSDSVSVYKAVPVEETPETFGAEGGTRVTVRMGGPGGDAGELFKNFTTARSIEMREIGAKTFLIEDSIRHRGWKLTNETKNILGYTCRKAIGSEIMMTGGMTRIMTSNNGTSQTDSSTAPKPTAVKVEAWYAESLNAPAGPDSYGMLPGVVLELNVDNGAIVFIATDVKYSVDKNEIKEPRKGKRITKDEFNKMQREMMMNRGGGMRVTM